MSLCKVATSSELPVYRPAAGPHEHILTGLTMLLSHDDRSQAAQQLAAELGCEDLLIFLRTDGREKFVPAPGFSQTLPDDARWHAFLLGCAPGELCLSRQTFPGRTKPEEVLGAAASDGTVLVTRPGNPDRQALAAMLRLLPLAAAALRREQALQATRTDFLSAASHELRTPLTGLMLQVQMLQRVAGRLPEDLPLTPSIRRLVAPMERSLRRLSTLAGDLVDVTRISADRLELRPEETDLAELAREVIERFSDLAERHGSVLSLEARGPVVGCWDPSRLDQVMTNLLANALTFGKGKPVTVLVTGGPDAARIEVRDHGPGIALADQERIFQRFERARPRDDGSGLGLGLYVAREIVRAHEGTLSCESHEGEGAIFTVELPYSSPQ